MRKVFRRYAPLALGLVAVCGQISRLGAAGPDASSGPALMSPTVEAALVNQAPARAARSTAAASTKRGSTDDWASATASDRGVGSNRHMSRPLPPASNSRFATADGPVEPAVSQAVANSWRRSSRASVRTATGANGSTAEEATRGEASSPAQQSAIAAKFSAQPNFVSPGARGSAAEASPSTEVAESVFEYEAPLPGAAPLLVAARVSTSATPETASDVSTATSAPTSDAADVANVSNTAAVSKPDASVKTVATAGTSSSNTTPASATAREGIAAGATPLAERRAPFGHRVARLRSAIQAGRADVQHASAQPRGANGAEQTAATGVKQTAGFEGTVIRDVPLSEAETIPAPGGETTTESTGLAESATGECTDCGDDCCEECCEECPRRRPLLALIDKLDECKAKCRSCCACNQESWNNCNCNGSYKFPVPPLYTYHWPGLYSAELMTDYHSPWRFPPLKPYTDELPSEGEGPPQPLTMVVPTSHRQAASTKPNTKPTTAPAKKPTAAPARASQAATTAKPATAQPVSVQRIATQATPLATVATAARPAASAVPAAAERIIGEPEPMSKKICRAYGIKE